MNDFSFKTELSYDDITLYSREISTVTSRFDKKISLNNTVDIEGRRFEMGVLMSAPMLDVSGLKMCSFMSNQKQLGVLHRFMNTEKWVESIWKVLNQSISNTISFSVGINDSKNKLSSLIDFLKDKKEEIKTVKPFIDIEGLQFIVCIDTANGASELLCSAIDNINIFKEKIEEEFSCISVSIMAGNIVTKEAAEFLYNLGVTFARVSIGSGSVCSTPMVTGIFRPVVSAIMEIDKWRKDNEISDFYIIADGGIRGAADVMKALAVGADFVMIGSLFAGFDESNGELIQDSDGSLYKPYRGMASYDMAKLNNSVNNLNKPIIPEGVTSKVPYKGLIDSWFQQFKGSMHSCMSYCNAYNLDEFRQNVKIVSVSGATNELRKPHKIN